MNKEDWAGVRVGREQPSTHFRGTHMKARSRFALITTTFAALSLSAIASADMKYAGGGGVEFKLPGGTAGLSIDGTSSEVSAAETGGKIVVTVKLDCAGKSCLKTG